MIFLFKQTIVQHF